MIIVLNGTAASGKGTLAGMLAHRLRLPHYDFGLIFRAIAEQRTIFDWKTIEAKIDDGGLSCKAGRIVSNNSDITNALTSEAAGHAAAVLASREEARLVTAARRFVRNVAFVADGRTISAIYPQADRHFEIVSDYDTAKERRVAQGGEAAVFRERWSLDVPRMKPSSKAIVVDTVGKSPEESLNFILGFI